MSQLGYACINMHLSDVPKSRRVTTNRSMIKRTFQTRGVPYASELALANGRDLLKILQWNEQHDIRFFRLSSDLFPWSSEYQLSDLPDYDAICDVLMDAGDFVYDHCHRVTTHPGPFNVLGSPRQHVVDNTIRELNTHAEIFDMLGLPTTADAKINIHVGGTYGGDFAGTAKRWCANFHKLSEPAQARVTVENDDRASMWSTQHLYDYIHKDILIPIVHDIHHHRFCPGGLTDQEAMSLAASTWGAVTPVVHYSESRSAEQNDPKIRDNAHSDYIYDYIDIHGLDVDVMIEAKAKELALLRYRELWQNGIELSSVAA